MILTVENSERLRHLVVAAKVAAVKSENNLFPHITTSFVAGRDHISFMTPDRLKFNVRAYKLPRAGFFGPLKVPGSVRGYNFI